MSETTSADFEERFVARQFDDIDREIASLMSVLKVDLRQPDIAERVLHNDASVCGTDNPAAFRKMRELIMLHFAVRERAFESLGPQEAQAIIATVVSRIRERFRKLGYPNA